MRAQQRFDYIAKDIGAFARAIVARLLAQADMVRKAELGCDPGAGLAADQCVEALRQRALGGLAFFEQPFRHRQAQHPVTQKLQPFIIHTGRHAAVGKRREPARLIYGCDAKPCQPVARFGGKLGHSRSPIRLQRADVNHVHGLIHSALPSVDHMIIVARPTSRSCGTRPTPPPGRD